VIRAQLWRNQIAWVLLKIRHCFLHATACKHTFTTCLFHIYWKQWLASTAIALAVARSFHPWHKYSKTSLKAITSSYGGGRSSLIFMAVWTKRSTLSHHIYKYKNICTCYQRQIEGTDQLALLVKFLLVCGRFSVRILAGTRKIMTEDFLIFLSMSSTVQR
jgi:hypothetical protein